MIDAQYVVAAFVPLSDLSHLSHVVVSQQLLHDLFENQTWPPRPNLKEERFGFAFIGSDMSADYYYDDSPPTACSLKDNLPHEDEGQSFSLMLIWAHKRSAK
jgi:hypothetical protein